MIGLYFYDCYLIIGKKKGIFFQTTAYKNQSVKYDFILDIVTSMSHAGPRYLISCRHHRQAASIHNLNIAIKTSTTFTNNR
jgi:hypothetical protein